MSKSTDAKSFLEPFLVWLSVEKGRRPATIEAYRRDINQFLSWCEESGVRLTGVDISTLEKFVISLKDREFAESSIARMAASLRGFFSYAVEEGLLESNPTTQLLLGKRKKSLPKPMSEEQIMVLLDSITISNPGDLRDLALLEFLYGTGCRVSEAIGVTLGDIDFAEGLVRVTGKGAKQRLVPIGAKLTEALRLYLGPDGRQLLLRESNSQHLFINGRGGQLSRQGVDLIVRKRGLAAGLPVAHLSAHIFRHSCATHMLEHGADIRVVQELLGHASIATTQTYTAVAASSLKREYLDAHPRANG